MLKPNGKNNWNANGEADCQYLKPRFSYLSGGGDSKNMVRLLKTTYEEGMAVVNSGAIYKKTCLSKSYKKDWVQNATADNINSEYPDVVYAYSVARGDGGYDVYWFTENETEVIVEGDTDNLFQNGGLGSKLQDVSGISSWYFRNLTSMSTMFSSCSKLQNVELHGDFSKVKSIENLFYNATGLTSVSINDGDADFMSLTTMKYVIYGWDYSKYSVFSSFISQIRLDLEKFPGGKEDIFRCCNNNVWTDNIVTTKNGIQYTLDNGYLTQGTTLPIELLEFSVKQEYEDVVFSWTTASETNNDFFTIEQSVDGQIFNDIARIEGVGTTTMQNNYDYSVEVNFSGVNYFRLKQTDFNGDYTYSDVKTITITFDYVRIYPVPAIDFITIEGDYNQVRFVDQQGRIHTPSRMADDNTYPIDSFPSGVYYAIVTMRNGEIVIRKIRKD